VVCDVVVRRAVGPPVARLDTHGFPVDPSNLSPQPRDLNVVAPLDRLLRVRWSGRSEFIEDAAPQFKLSFQVDALKPQPLSPLAGCRYMDLLVAADDPGVARKLMLYLAQFGFRSGDAPSDRFDGVPPLRRPSECVGPTLGIIGGVGLLNRLAGQVLNALEVTTVAALRMMADEYRLPERDTVRDSSRGVP
jgi:hypothetical protein